MSSVKGLGTLQALPFEIRHAIFVFLAPCELTLIFLSFGYGVPIVTMLWLSGISPTSTIMNQEIFSAIRKKLTFRYDIVSSSYAVSTLPSQDMVNSKYSVDFDLWLFGAIYVDGSENWGADAVDQTPETVHRLAERAIGKFSDPMIHRRKCTIRLQDFNFCNLNVTLGHDSSLLETIGKLTGFEEVVVQVFAEGMEHCDHYREPEKFECSCLYLTGSKWQTYLSKTLGGSATVRDHRDQTLTLVFHPREHAAGIKRHREDL